MKITTKKTGTIAESNKFNTHGIGEVIVYYEDGFCSSEFIRDFDVFLESKKSWMDMLSAFKQKLLITDNYNTSFREPLNSEEKERGWY